MASCQKPKISKLIPCTPTASHLYLNGREINEEEIDLNFYNYKKLKVLYLHKNNINVIKNLNGLTTLTHLFLQWNNISKIENLDKLENLQKLYLGYNQIRKLENIENLKNLKELHIEAQRLPKNVEFIFDISRSSGVAKSLEILNASRLNLVKLDPIRVFSNLKVLLASHNFFKNPRELGEMLGEFIYLKKVTLNGCPAQKDNHYRIKITAGACNLEYLDEKYIPKTSRVFIKRMEQFRNESRTGPLNRGDGDNEGPSMVDLHKSNFTLEAQPKKSSDDISFRPWNSLTFIKKPMRFHHKKVSSDSLPPTAEHDYQLQGQNILY